MRFKPTLLGESGWWIRSQVPKLSLKSLALIKLIITVLVRWWVILLFGKPVPLLDHKLLASQSEGVCNKPLKA